MGWAMCKTENGKPVESDQGKDVYTTTNYVFAQLLDYYGMAKESKDVYKHMDRVVFDYGNSMITADNLRAELEKEAGESKPGPHYIVAAYPRPGAVWTHLAMNHIKDHASSDCYGSPAFGLSSVSWDYNPYTHHTNRDTYDKVVFDEVKGNATIVAMLVYLASEDPTFITHDRRDLTQPDTSAAARAGGGGRGGRGGGGGGRATAPVDAMGWDLSCPKGPRVSPDSGRTP